MTKVEIYTTMLCPFCTSAKHLLKGRGVSYVEHDVTMDRAGRQKMVQRAGGRTSVPQVFIDEIHVGGCDDLYALNIAGRLDTMLSPT